MNMVLIGSSARGSEVLSDASRLQLIATGLNKLIYGREVDEFEGREFVRVVDLLNQIDDSPEHYRGKECAELCTTATRLRPLFYGTLIKAGILPDEFFTEDLYKTLRSCGDSVLLDVGRLREAQRVFQSVATASLLELQNSHRAGQI